MKIAMFSDTYYPQNNGAVVAIQRFSRELVKMGHEVHVFAPKGERVPAKESGITNHLFPSVSLHFYPEFRTALPIPALKTFREMRKDFDIVHSHSMFAMGMRGYFAAKFFRLPLLGTFHTLIPEYTVYLSRRFESQLRKISWSYCRSYYNLCDAVTTPTDSMVSLLRERGFSKQMHVISNGVDFKKFEDDGNAIREEYGIKGKLVLYLGRLSHEKRVSDLIRAKDHFDGTLMVCGSGPIRKELEALSRGKDIIFTGFVPEEKKASYYRAADVFGFPSTGDTQGIVILESFAAGTPVVATRSQGAVDMIADGKDGFIAEPRNPQDIGEKIQSILADEPLRKKMSSNALDKAREFSWEKCTGKLVEVYKSI